MSVTSNSQKWEGKERRSEGGGRRGTDTCSEHCFYVNEWADLKKVHKEDEKEHARQKEDLEKKIESKSPMNLVVALIASIFLSIGYTFTVSSTIHTDMTKIFSDIQKEFTERMITQNQIVVQQQNKIISDLEVAKSRQADIKALLEKHISKWESRNTTNDNGR